MYISESKLSFYHGYITLFKYIKLIHFLKINSFFEWVRGLLKSKQLLSNYSRGKSHNVRDTDQAMYLIMLFFTYVETHALKVTS